MPTHVRAHCKSHAFCQPFSDYRTKFEQFEGTNMYLINRFYIGSYVYVYVAVVLINDKLNTSKLMHCNQSSPLAFSVDPSLLNSANMGISL